MYSHRCAANWDTCTVEPVREAQGWGSDKVSGLCNTRDENLIYAADTINVYSQNTGRWKACTPTEWHTNSVPLANLVRARGW